MMRQFTAAQQQNVYIKMPDRWCTEDLDEATDARARTEITLWIKQNTNPAAWAEELDMDAWHSQMVVGKVHNFVWAPPAACALLGIARRPVEKPVEGGPTHYYEVGIAWPKKVSTARLTNQSRKHKLWKDMAFLSPPAHRGLKVCDVFYKYFFSPGPKLYKPLYPDGLLSGVQGVARPPSFAHPVVTRQAWNDPVQSTIIMQRLVDMCTYRPPRVVQEQEARKQFSRFAKRKRDQAD
jgi:hypothetical protein